MKTIEERFFSKVIKSNTCWFWTGCKDKCGYGLLYYKNRKNINTHRLSYELHFGEVLDGLCVCHSCDNPSCVNPQHLFLATHKQNMEDKKNKGRTYNGNQKGINNPGSKLTENEVIEIKYLLESNISQSNIAKKYNISQTLVSAIKLEKIWKEIK